jgi:hypothetical protein
MERGSHGTDRWRSGRDGVKIGRLPLPGRIHFSPAVSWSQDASVGEIPAGKSRPLPDYLWVELTAGDEVRLKVVLRADVMPPHEYELVVSFTGDEPQISFS